MSKELGQKQIEEMAGFIYSLPMCTKDDCDFVAKLLIGEGYRRQSETIDTFVARVKDSMELLPTVYKSFYGKILDRVACEMKGGAE